jgi:hypothetical protein
MRARFPLAVIVPALAFVFALAWSIASPAPAQASPQVYLMKGGFGGVFSTGLDDLAGELRRRGIRATVTSYTAYQGLAARAIAREKSGGGPVVIVGHSWGADNAVAMARTMGAAGAPVALVVAFGPTHGLTVPANVARVINFYQGGTRMRGGRGFHGSIANVDLDGAPGIDHFNVEKIRRLHARVIAAVRALPGSTGRLGKVHVQHRRHAQHSRHVKHTRHATHGRSLTRLSGQ